MLSARTVTITLLTLHVVVSAATLLGQAPPGGTTPSVWDGVFTEAQAARGRTSYLANCASCHGDALQGGEAKALSGQRFWTDWKETSADYLLEQISRNMPFSEDGSLRGTLSPGTYAEIVAHILKTNGFPGGERELTAQSALGVQIIAKEGPGELPADAMARIVGCLTKGSGGWQLVKASRPARVRSSELMQKVDAPLGDRTMALKFVLTPLDKYAGYRMSATGRLIGEGGRDGLNVSLVAPIAATCEP